MVLYVLCYLSRSVLVVYGSAFAGSLLVAVFVPSSVTSLGAVDSLMCCCMSFCCCNDYYFVVELDLTSLLIVIFPHHSYSFLVYVRQCRCFEERVSSDVADPDIC